MVNYNVERKTFTSLENDTIEKIDMFLKDKLREGYSQSTIDSYFYILHQFTHHVQKHVSQITSYDIKEYLSSRSESIQSATLNTVLYTIKSFFNWLVEEEMLIKNPSTKIKPVKIPFKMGTVLSSHELELIKRSCDNIRVEALFLVLHSTGCRISEVLNAKIEDVNFDKRQLVVTGKGSKQRITFLNESSVFALNKYLDSRKDDCDYLFATSKRPFKKLETSSAREMFDKVLDKCNFEKNVTFHTIRRSTATELHSRGMEIFTVSKILGHSPNNIKSIQHYVEIKTNTLQSEYNKYFGN